MSKNKPKSEFYLVHVREVHIQTFQVKAANAADAVRRVADGEGRTLEAFEYSHTLDPETWTAEQITSKKEPPRPLK